LIEELKILKEKKISEMTDGTFMKKTWKLDQKSPKIFEKFKITFSLLIREQRITTYKDITKKSLQEVEENRKGTLWKKRSS
jgi:hypothetical protein